MAAKVTVDGLTELRAALKGADDAVDEALAAVYPGIAASETARATMYADGQGAQAQHFSDAFKPTSAKTFAAIGTYGPGIGAIWGSKHHSGWYAEPQYDQDAKGNNPPWVGNDWIVGGPGGPKGLGPVLMLDRPLIEAAIEAAVVSALTGVFGPAF